MSGDRPGRRREAVVLASGPVLGAAVGAVTNIITATWSWWLFSSLLVLITLAAAGAALASGPERTGIPPGDDPPPRPRVNTLPPAAAVFFGREDELRRLAQAEPPAAASRPFVCAITGRSGAGKTELAVQAAHRLAARYPDAQLFLTYRSHAGPAGRLGAQDVLAQALTAVGASAASARVEVDALSSQWRSTVDDGRFLLVLDDVTHADQVRPLLPNSRRAMVIVTSRRVVAGVDADLHIDVGGISGDEAYAVITAILARASCPVDGPAVRTMAELYRLPLTVRHVADRLISEQHEPALRSGGRPHRPGDHVDVDPFGVSVSALEPRDRLVFRRMALHPGPHVTPASAAALADVSVQVAGNALTELHRRGIIVRPDPYGYGVHDRVRDLALQESERHDSGAARAAARERLFRLTARQLALANAAISSHLVIDVPVDGTPEPEVPQGEKEALVWLETYLVDLRAVARLAVDEEWAAAWHLTCGLTYFLRIHRNIVQAEELNESALQIAVALGDVLGQAYSQFQVGVMHRITGRYRSALGHTQAASACFEALGDDRGLASCGAELAVIHYHLAEYQPAQEAMERAVAIYGRRTSGARGVANGCGVLGMISRATGDYGAARARLNEAVAIYQDLRNLRSQAWIRIELGTLDRLVGDYPNALAQFAAAHALYQDTGDRNGCAWADREAGITRRLLGEHAVAQDLLEGALRVFQEMDSARNTADAQVELGPVHRARGDLAAARNCATDALNAYERMGNRRGAAWATVELGVLDARQERWPAAAARFEQARRTYAAIADRSGAGRVALESGRLALARGEAEAARRLLEQARSVYGDLGAPEALLAEDLLSRL